MSVGKEKINVLSLFDGISCGQMALERAGIEVENYFASEIDKYAISVTQKNYPNTKQLGSVLNVKSSDLPNIDFLIGGSPCKDLSIANKEQKGLNGNQSQLFYEYLRLLKELKPKYFLLENVVPIGNWKQVMDEHIGIEGIQINSSLFVPQNRKRIYWTNIPFEMPIQKEYVFNFDENVSEKYFANSNILENEERLRFVLNSKNKLCGCLTEAIARNGSSKEYMRWIGWVYNNTNEFRKPTPVECERLQGVRQNYTDCVSDTQRYKMLGNGWTVDVIAHIFSFLKREEFFNNFSNENI